MKERNKEKRTNENIENYEKRNIKNENKNKCSKQFF